MRVILTVILSLLAVIGLIVLTLYVTKTLMNKFNFQSSRDGGIKIISSVGIGQDKSIIAVKAGKKQLLLGVCPSDVKVLCELDDEDIDIMVPPQETLQNKSFGDILAENVMNTFGGKKDGKK